MVICVLCNTGSMHRKIVRSHLNGCHHQLNLSSERLIERTKKVRVTCPATEIEKLGLLRWRQQIKADIHDYIFDSSDVVHEVPSSVTHQLQKYTKLEKISLLELAVWKASCLWFDGSLSFRTMQDILDQWAIDKSFDPVTYKAERRFTSSTAVIMRGVLQFLE